MIMVWAFRGVVAKTLSIANHSLVQARCPYRRVAEASYPCYYAKDWNLLMLFSNLQNFSYG